MAGAMAEATEQQLSMLNRYDDLLAASEAAALEADDGRYDDAEENEEEATPMAQ